MMLFLDEPSAGLDPITSAELDALIKRLARSLGVTFIIVTHELPSIFAIADRVIMIDRRAQGHRRRRRSEETPRREQRPLGAAVLQPPGRAGGNMSAATNRRRLRECTDERGASQ